MHLCGADLWPWPACVERLPEVRVRGKARGGGRDLPPAGGFAKHDMTALGQRLLDAKQTKQQNLRRGARQVAGDLKRKGDAPPLVQDAKDIARRPAWPDPPRPDQKPAEKIARGPMPGLPKP